MIVRWIVKKFIVALEKWDDITDGMKGWENMLGERSVIAGIVVGGDEERDWVESSRREKKGSVRLGDSNTCVVLLTLLVLILPPLSLLLRWK